MRRAGTPTQQMEVHLAMFARRFWTPWFGFIVQRPIPGFPIIDASAFELGEHVEHRSTSGSDERRPLRQLGRGQFASLPDRSGGIHDEVSTVIPAHSTRFLSGRTTSPPSQENSVRLMVAPCASPSTCPRSVRHGPFGLEQGGQYAVRMTDVAEHRLRQMTADLFPRQVVIKQGLPADERREDRCAPP